MATGEVVDGVDGDLMLAERLPAPVTAPAAAGNAGEAELLARVSRCRELAAGLAHPERHFCLQLFDLARLRQRFGTRWELLRPRAAQLICGGLVRELAADELQIDPGGDFVLAVRAAPDRRVVERHGQLLAADVTARLCGTIPSGAVVRVATYAFDPRSGLVGASGDELAAGLAHWLAAVGRNDAEARPTSAVEARFSPVLHFRKRLVSAYRLTAADGRQPDDVWALAMVEGWLRDGAHARTPALIAPVCHATVADSRRRQAFIKQCALLPAMAQRRLVLELPDPPPSLMGEVVAGLRPFCLALVARVGSPERDLGPLSAAGIRGVSLAADALDAGALAGLATLAGRARIAGLRSLLVEVALPSQCRAAFAAGIDHVSGDALLPALPRPGRAVMLARGR
ncbi:MAG: hypothetical protein U1E52_10730 [Geminicoccaceae bacterium]